MLLDIRTETLSWLLAVAISGVRVRPGPEGIKRNRAQLQVFRKSSGGTRGHLIALAPLGLPVSNPPTQADVQTIADKVDELTNSLQGVRGRDAFHRVPLFWEQIRDAVERVPTIPRGACQFASG